jgi:hypothetical protein
MRSSSMERLLRKVLLASLVTPFSLGFVGCGGKAEVVQGTGDAGSGGDGATADSGALDSPTNPGCATTGTPPTGRVCDYNLPFTGDPASCGLTTNFSSAPICAQLCMNTGFQCRLVVGPGGDSVECMILCGTGRRPPGYRARARRPARSQVGDYFAQMTELEAVSVDAFMVLRDELALHGAPRRLLRAAESAAQDEVRHARMARALTRRFGGSARPPHVAKRELRSLEEVAVENAVEGCVRETFGALTAMFQARAAADPSVRAAMSAIARDESRHAALGWQVAAWAEARLGAAARARVSAARHAAVEQLHAEACVDPPSPVAALWG